MKDGPLVSAVIPTYNSGARAVRAVQSVLAQTYQPVECVVADDGSADDTLDRLGDLGDAIRLVPCGHRGIPFARNAGIEAATGQIIAFLDSDDEWMPRKLERCVPRLVMAPDMGVVYTRLVVHDEVKRQRYELPIYNREGWIARELFVECRMSTSTLVTRRACLDAVGLFDEDLLRAQDWDLMIRLAEAYPYAFVDEVLSERHLHSGNISVRRSDLYAKFNLMVIEKALARRADLYRDLESLALSRASVRFGLEHYRRFEMGPARAHFRTSLSRRVNAEALSYWARTFLPAGLVRRLRAWRERRVQDTSAAADEAGTPDGGQV